MFTAIETFRKKLREGRVCLGAGITFSDPAVVEALGPAADFFWIDLEHTLLGGPELLAHLIAARAVGVASLVRIPIADLGHVKRVLDSGANGLIVPQIHSADEVARMVAACRYPPAGNRGYGPRRPSNYGRHGGPDYLAEANEHVFVSAQIETAAALADLDAILAVPTLDSIVIGPQDLSGSLGIPGQLEHPKLIEAIETIIAKARRAKVFVGIGMGSNEAYAERAARWGVNWIQCGNDFSYMVERNEQLFAAIRKRTEAKGT